MSSATSSAMDVSRTPRTYVNPESVLAVSIVFPVLAVIVVAGRIWSRMLRRIPFGADDYLCFAAAIVLLGCSADLITGVARRTVGYHTPPSSTNFNIPSIPVIKRVEFSYNQMWYFGITCVKLSFLFFYRRIFRGRVFNAVNYVTMAIVLAWGITFSFTNLFQCGSHISLSWGFVPAFFNPMCIDSLSVFFANALISCFLDVVIICIPMPLIWQLNMARGTRVILMLLFAVGGFCVAASSLRLATHASLWWAVRTDNENMSVMGLRGADFFGIVSLALFWAQIELGVATVACCLPSIKQLVTDTPAFKSLRSTISISSLRRKFGSVGTSRTTTSTTKDDQQPIIEDSSHQYTRGVSGEKNFSSVEVANRESGSSRGTMTEKREY